MLKKRIIFTLLLKDDQFVLSRNFRLQKVGDANWLEKNYNFKYISRFIDELIILNVSKKKDINFFCNIVKKVINKCFVPISFGGGIRCQKDAELLFKAGADKIVINSLVDIDKNTINQIAGTYGSQSIILSLDFKKEKDDYTIWTEDGNKKNKKNISNYLSNILRIKFGELYLNSIDRDGTGFGYDLNILKKIPQNFNYPIIMAGGAGNSRHFLEALKNKKVDAVATANLYNFIGDGLKKSREEVLTGANKFPEWDEDAIKKMERFFA